MTTPEAAPDSDIVSRRVLAAPRARVFEAFADPAQLAAWWGPKGFRSTFRAFELRPGGAWRFVMHGPDGVDYENANDFVEVVAPERVVFRHVDATHGFQMTMTFREDAGGTATELVWRMRFDAADEAARVRSFVVVANEENLDRLAAHLATMEPGESTASNTLR